MRYPLLVKAAFLMVPLGLISTVVLGCSVSSEEPSRPTREYSTIIEGSPSAPPTTSGRTSERTSEQCINRRFSSGTTTTDRPLALGAFVKGVEAEPGRIIDQFTETVGQEPAAVMLYQNWETNSAFDPDMLDLVAERDATPIVTWAPRKPDSGRNQRTYSLQKIIRGRYDSYIRTWAQEASVWDKPLYLRFAHEMNAAFYPWGVGVNGNTAADYVAAWRHIHDIFEQEGAKNVRWVWSPLADSPTSEDSLEQMYPGDDYVDWLALDGYNWGTEGPVLSEWRTVAEIFGPSYDKLVSISGKPVMIAEVATAEAGGSKADWIEEGLLEDVPSRLPQVRAILWFSSDKAMDWRIDSSPESLEAYSRVADSCLYRGRLP
ncbi:MAG: glycosyl hydrolase [Rubrobacteraceae bacterium]